MRMDDGEFRDAVFLVVIERFLDKFPLPGLPTPDNDPYAEGQFVEKMVNQASVVARKAVEKRRMDPIA